MWGGDLLVWWSDSHVVLLSVEMMVEGRVSVWDAGMPLLSIKGTKYLSYIRTEPQWKEPGYNQRTVLCPLYQVHRLMLLFSHTRCVRHSSRPCSCVLPLSPPRGCSHPCGLSEQSLSCPLPKTVGHALPWAFLHGEMVVVTGQTTLESVPPLTLYDWLHSSAMSCLVYWKF